MRLTTPDGRAYSLRAARPNDTGRILDHAWAVHAEAADSFVTDRNEFEGDAAQLRSKLQRTTANSLFLIAEADGDVIGTVSVEGGRYRKVRHNGYIGLSVRHGWRRQGVATALMRQAEEEARRAGVLRRLTLVVFATNLPAVRLYESLGYEIEGRRVEAVRIGDDYVDELCMARSISEP